MTEQRRERAQTACDGRCLLDGDCQGDVVSVEVSRFGGSWGTFRYCETAIARDESNGFRVRKAGGNW